MVPIFNGTDSEIDIANRYIVSERGVNPGRAIILGAYPDYKLIINGDPDDDTDTPTFEFYKIAGTSPDVNEQSPLNIGNLTCIAEDAYDACIAKDQALGGGYSTPAN